MPVPAGQSGFISHTGNGVATNFSYDFLIIDSSHLDVYIDDVLQTSGFTVNGVRNASGGSVDFSTAPANSSVIELRRNVPYGRTEFDYQTSGELRALTIDDDLDTVVMMVQQIVELLGRRLALSDTSPLTNSSFDALSNRIANLTDPLEPQDADTKSARDSAIATAIATAGGTVSFGFASPEVPPSSTFTALPNRTYLIEPNSTNNITLPLLPPVGTLVRFVTTDVSIPAFNLNANTDQFIRLSDDEYTHSGSSSSTIFTDSLATRQWSGTSLVGMIAYNRTDGSFGEITAQSENTFTVGGGLLTNSGDGLFEAGDKVQLMYKDFNIDENVSWGLIECSFRGGSGPLRYWNIRINGSTAKGVLIDPQTQLAFIGTAAYQTLHNYLVSLNNRLDQRLTPNNSDTFGETSTTFNLGTRFNHKFTEFTGSSAATATVSTNNGAYRHMLINRGSANVTITTSTDVTTLSLLNGAVTTSAADVVVAPGEWCWVQTNDDGIARIWGSDGLTK